MPSPKLLSLQEMAILVLVLTVFAFVALDLFGREIGTAVTYVTIITLTLLALINKNTSLIRRLLNKRKRKPYPNS